MRGAHRVVMEMAPSCAERRGELARARPPSRAQPERRFGGLVNNDPKLKRPAITLSVGAAEFVSAGGLLLQAP